VTFEKWVQCIFPYLYAKNSKFLTGKENNLAGISLKKTIANCIQVLIGAKRPSLANNNKCSIREQQREFKKTCLWTFSV
jgi:hypothetical protein